MASLEKNQGAGDTEKDKSQKERDENIQDNEFSENESDMEQQYTQEIVNMSEDDLPIDKNLEDKLLSGGDEVKIANKTKNPNSVEQNNEGKF